MKAAESTNSDTDAAVIAVDALGFVANDATLLQRFLALSGIEASAIREASREPGFLAGVLRFIAQHEPTLIAFCEASGHKPEAVMRAMRTLPGGDDAWMGSV